LIPHDAEMYKRPHLIKNFFDRRSSAVSPFDTTRPIKDNEANDTPARCVPRARRVSIAILDLAGVADAKSYAIGKSIVPVIRDPSKGVQDCTIFSFDDRFFVSSRDEIMPERRT
jgi:hypothetical protein